jgi:hypothetical protein
MYDFYPEWGPARHRDETEPQPAVRRPRYWRAPAMAGMPGMAGAAEPRDAAWERPDDN